MQALLANLNSVPGVVGSMVCSAEGRVLAQVFPAPFQAETLHQAAAALSDSYVGLETVTGPVSLLDLRYGDARIVVKPTGGGLLVLLCAKSVNLQLLVISASVAGKRLEKVAAAPEVRAEAVPEPPEAAAGAVGEPDEAATPPEGPSDPKKPKKKMKWWPSV